MWSERKIMTAAASTPKPLPLSGQRPLSAKEQVRRSQALACNIPDKNMPSCTGQAFLGVFFDGTGNNRDDDVGLHKHSNVVRLWRVHLDNSDATDIAPPVFIRKEYIPGVGTPFKEIGEAKESRFAFLKFATGKAMANGGQSRIFWGLIQTINALHRYVKHGKALLSDKEAGKFAESKADGDWSDGIEKLKPYLATLKTVLAANKPQVTQFNISVYGFSRGAAQARVFCNFFYKLCENTADGYTFAGVPVRIYFLGIFDTVAAVGATGGDIINDEIVSGHAAWAKGNLAIHPAIERCVHFVASHEVRASFPLDSVRYLGKYPANCFEVTYPGVHSDVGGGYRPITQGRSALPADGVSYSFSALLPCIDMYHQAQASGVPLQVFKEMDKSSQRDFKADQKTMEDLNAYLNADIISGPLEEMFKQRMNRYRYYRYRKLTTFADDAAKQGAPAEDVQFLRLTNKDFEEKCLGYKRKYANVTAIIKKEESQQVVNHSSGTTQTRAEKKRALLAQTIFPEDLEMWEGMHRVGELPVALTKFFDYYVHDSLAGFAQDGVHEYKFNGRGHFRNRTIYDKG